MRVVTARLPRPRQSATAAVGRRAWGSLCERMAEAGREVGVRGGAGEGRVAVVREQVGTGKLKGRLAGKERRG